MTVGMLANAVGIDTQRLYSMVRRGDIRSQRLVGRRVVIPPDEANRVIASVMHVDTKGGPRVYFNLEKVEDRI
jgi:predicted site-specific integrase-resolvase